MTRGKKAILFEAFGRIILMIIAIWAVFNVGKIIAQAAGIGTSDIGEEFNRLAKEINELRVGDVNQVFVTLDTGTSIIGFSKTSNSYECYDCGTEKGGLSSFFKKPNNEQCSNQPCICLCRLPKTANTIAPYEITCENMPCKPLNEDLAAFVELRKYFEDLEKRDPEKYTKLLNAKWKGGFLLERHSRNDFKFNALPSPQSRRFTAFVEKEQRGNMVYTTVCPGFDCASQDSSQVTQQPQALLKGCETMRECVKETNVYLEKDRFTNTDSISRECKNPDNVKATFETENDCSLINSCMLSKISIYGKCEKNNRGNYVISFNLPSS